MTDDELAKLKPGDRVQHETLSDVVGEVQRVDRRRVFFRDSIPGHEYAYHAGELIVTLDENVSGVSDDPTLRSLESRWRALTDEVLVAIKRLIADGVQLDVLAVQFSTDDEGAQAGVWRLDLEGGANAPGNPVAICSVGTMLGKATTP